VILPQPVIIAPPRAVVVRPEPVYLWVPPGHRKNWAAHCREYNACGVPVYFVRHDWYDQHVRRALEAQRLQRNRFRGLRQQCAGDAGDDRSDGIDPVELTRFNL